MSHRMDFWWNDQIISVEKLHELAHFLLERETITGEEFMGILNR